MDKKIKFEFSIEDVVIIRNSLGMMMHDEVEQIIDYIEDVMLNDFQATYQAEKAEKLKQTSPPHGLRKDGTPAKKRGRPSKTAGKK